MTTNRTRTLGAKHIFFAAFALATLFVFYVYEAPFLDPQRHLVNTPPAQADFAMSAGSFSRQTACRIGSP